MAWGAGIGAFTSGFANGYSIGQRIRDDRRNDELHRKKLREYDQRLGEGEIRLNQLRQQEGARNEMIGIGQKARAGFDAAVAAGNADPQNPGDWYAKNLAPGYTKFYLENGMLDEAQKWDKWITDTRTRQTVNNMGLMIGQLEQGVKTGDFGALKSTFGKTYNGLPPAVTGGARFENLEIKKDESGAVSGVTAIFKNPEGKAVTQSWTDLSSFANTLTGLLDPHTLFTNIQSAEKARGEVKANKAKRLAEADVDLYKEKQKIELGITGYQSPAQEYKEAVEATKHLDGTLGTQAEIDDYIRRKRQTIARLAPGIGASQPPAPPAPTVKINPRTAMPVQTSPADRPPQLAAPSPPGIAAGGQRRAPDGSGPQAGVPQGQSAAPAGYGNPQAPGIGMPNDAQGASASPVVAPPSTPGPAAAAAEGVIRPGNIDPARLPRARDAAGTVTLPRMVKLRVKVSGLRGGIILIPAVVGNRVVSDEEAIRAYSVGGSHLGIFRDEASADRHIAALQQQGQNAVQGGPLR